MIKTIRARNYSMFKRDLLIKLFTEPFKNLKNTGNGGCGKIALLMADELNARGIKATIAFVVEPKRGNIKDFISDMGVKTLKDALEEAHRRYYIDEFSTKDWPFWHLAVKVGNRYFDDTGDITDNDTFWKETVTPDTMRAIVSEDAHWNKKFLRKNSKRKLGNMQARVKTTFERFYN